MAALTTETRKTASIVRLTDETGNCIGQRFAFALKRHAGRILKIESGKEQDFLAWLYETTSVVRQLLGLCERLGTQRAMVFLSRFVCKPVSFLKWFRFMHRFKQRHRLGCPNDDLLRKKTYKFFARGLPDHRGFDLLVDHFNLAGAALPRNLLESTWSGRPIDIGTVVGRRDSYGLSMRLSVHSGTNHEGAFSIRLTRQSDRLDLVNLSFILYKLDNFRYTVAIGGLQGSRRQDSKRAFVDATRDMNGLRPKDAALLVMEGITMRGGADHFLGVSNTRHTINYRALEKRLKKHADMDEYWFDRGGQAGGEFGFVIPVRNSHLAPPLGRRDIYKLEFLDIGKNLFGTQAPRDASLAA